MKVIFLDFDGVLNSQGSFHLEDRIRKDNHRRHGVKGKVQETLCHVCASNFQYVLDQYKDVKIVISSTWRELYSIDWLKEKLASYHIDSSRVIDRTPTTFGGERGHEINLWLDKHPEVTHYVIIDDNDGDISEIHGDDRFVKTAWHSGMTIGHAFELVEKLSSKNQKKIDEKAKSEQKGP